MLISAQPVKQDRAAVVSQSEHRTEMLMMLHVLRPRATDTNTCLTLRHLWG